MQAERTRISHNKPEGILVSTMGKELGVELSGEGEESYRGKRGKGRREGSKACRVRRQAETECVLFYRTVRAGK